MPAARRKLPARRSPARLLLAASGESLDYTVTNNDTMIRSRRPTPGVLLIPLLAAIVACAESPQPDAAPVGTEDPAMAGNPQPQPTEAGDSLPEPPAGPVQRWLSRLPDGALMRGGACPFECCVYGEWEAESQIALVSEPREGASPAGELAPGTSFQADSGFVRVTQVSLVAVTDTVTPMPDRQLQPGDTLVLLDYVGEGYHNAWLDGEFVEVADFWSSATGQPRGEVIGEHQSEWWVHATTGDGTGGWFRADVPGVELGGVDACG